MGIAGVLFFVLLSVSGVMLMHAETLHLKDKMIAGKYIPDKYFEINQPSETRVNLFYASPTNRDTFFMGANNGILKTTDGGKSWTEANQGLYNLDISVIIVDPLNSEVIYAGTKNGIFKSTNAGESWDDWFEETSGLEHTDIADLAIDPTNSERIYAAAMDDIFLSEDGGESWNEIYEETSSEGTRHISSLHILSENPSIIFAGTRFGLIKTTDGGKSWKEIPGRLANKPIKSFFSLASNPHNILMGTDSGLIQSLDSGKTWRISLKNKPVHIITSYHENGKENLIAATTKEIFKSPDNGQTWELISKTSESEMVINAVFFTGTVKKHLLAGTNKGLFSIDLEDNWNYLDLNIEKNSIDSKSMKMSLLKLITEMHTGRFFGNYFYLIFDIASVFLIIISITGAYIFFFRTRVWQKQKVKIEKLDKVDIIMDFNEKSIEISKHSENIHELTDHIKKHVLACKILSKNDNHKELKKIEGHMNSIDEKLHHLMNHIEDMSIK